MLRSLWIAVAALALASPASAQHLPPIERAASVGKAGGNPRLSAANTMIVSLPPGSGPVAKYPLLFGRPFLVGAVPSGRCPVVAVNGVAVPTQADIKNRYPDGSAKYAVIAIQPDIAALGRLTLTFGPGACNNAPLTQAQMLGPNYNFDAQMTLQGPAALYGSKTPDTKLSDWTAITDGGLAAAINGAAYKLTGLNFSAAGSMSAVSQVIQAALSAAGIPATIAFQTVENSNFLPSNAGTTGFSRFVLTGAYGAGATIGLASAPASGTDIVGLLGLGSPAVVAQGSSQVVSARTMLANGDYALWTSGPVAQTIILGDDSPTRKYDVGFGDGYHPFRPHFYATFWPATNQVHIRAVGSNNLTSEVEDIAYRLSVSIGQRDPAVVLTSDLSANPANRTSANPQPRQHWAMTSWTREFWLGRTPPSQVNIDNNLAYLTATRFLPNYDTSLPPIPEATIASEYAAWTKAGKDIGDAGLWDPGMGDAGQRPEIGPYPTWHVLWVYSGDWRRRAVALGQSDLAAAWNLELRESVAGKRLSRSDAAGSSTGYGRTISVVDHATLLTKEFGYAYTTAPDAPAFVGPYNQKQPWEADDAHQPSPFYINYVLTGDPWDLQEMYLWAGFTALMTRGARANIASTDRTSRGPTGAYGGVDGQWMRAPAWTGRNRAETAFIAPDGDPEKFYFTYMTNDMLAGWEGGVGITGTIYDGAPMKIWAAALGNPFSTVPGVSPLGNFANDGNGKDLGFPGIFKPGTVSGGFSPWTHWYFQYALGRINELGFAALPLERFGSRLLDGMVNQTKYPQLLTLYFAPTYYIVPPGGWIQNWKDFVSTFDTRFLCTTVPQSACNYPRKDNDGYGDLIQYFQGGVKPEGRPEWAQPAAAMMADNRDTGSQGVWGWVNANLYQPIKASGRFVRDDGSGTPVTPKWDIVPRTDANVLPVQPTVTP